MGVSPVLPRGHHACPRRVATRIPPKKGSSVLGPLRGRMRPPALGMVTLAASGGCSAHGWAPDPPSPLADTRSSPARHTCAWRTHGAPRGGPSQLSPPGAAPAQPPRLARGICAPRPALPRGDTKGSARTQRGPEPTGSHSLPTHKFGVSDEPPGPVPAFSMAPDRQQRLGARPVAVLTGVSAALPAAAPPPRGAARPRLRAGAAGAAGLPLRPFRRLRATGRSREQLFPSKMSAACAVGQRRAPAASSAAACTARPGARGRCPLLLNPTAGHGLSPWGRAHPPHGAPTPGGQPGKDPQDRGGRDAGGMEGLDSPAPHGSARGARHRGKAPGERLPGPPLPAPSSPASCGGQPALELARLAPSTPACGFQLSVERWRQRRAQEASSF